MRFLGFAEFRFSWRHFGFADTTVLLVVASEQTVEGDDLILKLDDDRMMHFTLP